MRMKLTISTNHKSSVIVLSRMRVWGDDIAYHNVRRHGVAYCDVMCQNPTWYDGSLTGGQSQSHTVCLSVSLLVDDRISWQPNEQMDQSMVVGPDSPISHSYWTSNQSWRWLLLWFWLQWWLVARGLVYPALVTCFFDTACQHTISHHWTNNVAYFHNIEWWYGNLAGCAGRASYDGDAALG